MTTPGWGLNSGKNLIPSKKERSETEVIFLETSRKSFFDPTEWGKQIIKPLGTEGTVSFWLIPDRQKKLLYLDSVEGNQALWRAVSLKKESKVMGNFSNTVTSKSCVSNG